ncbi:MAG TPA: chaperone modulator CbpM [Verrucomicrobiae bacterium]|jgi:DNA-binding transcriptional MerR regulator|nr:chaperone modulator CbpM [Verrucomicrobiae bacterium]
MAQKKDLPPAGRGLQVFDPQPGSLYSLETVIHLTGASRRSILIYCKSGLIRPAADPKEEPLAFDEEAIYHIRRIEFLRTAHGINLAGIRMIFDLMNELRRLQHEMRFFRP